MPKILIVDDDAALSAWLAAILTDAGYAIETLADGEGVSRLLALGVVDLALIDYHLPGQSGLEVVRHLRAMRNSTPVVMLTADGSQQVAVEAFRAGAADFIAKPVDPDYLKIIVARTLATHSKTLKDTAFRALGYMRHKEPCAFLRDGTTCSCGLKDVFEDIQAYT